jgi:prepilin-type N-terminal cleavage/methylation domain-containing protein
VRSGPMMTNKALAPHPDPLPEGEGESSAVLQKVFALRGFTLIELILVMTILTIAVSLTAPSLANFFRGRTLDSEARRLLSLTRHGQSRAVSEGVPMDLWIDASQGTFGLEAEPSYEQADPNGVNLSFDKDIQVQVVSANPSAGLGSDAAASSSTTTLNSHANLPTIRFLPDGSISETSPRMLKLTGRDGIPLSLGLSRNRLNYEIQSRNQ